MRKPHGVIFMKPSGAVVRFNDYSSREDAERAAARLRTVGCITARVRRANEDAARPRVKLVVA